MSKVFSLIIITVNLPNAVIFHSTLHSLYMYIQCIYIFFACNSEAKVPPRRGKKKKKKNVLIITNVMNSYTGLGYQPVY